MKLNWNLIVWILIIIVFSCSSSKETITKQKKKDFVIVNDLYWSKYEVTNQEYNLFLKELKDQNRNDYEQCKIKNEKWDQVEDLRSIGSAMSRNYHYHPAFDKYPVVNISFYGAQQYCKWLTKRAKEKGMKQIYRLPTLEEFKELYKTLIIKIDVDNSIDSNELKMNMKYTEGRELDGGKVTVAARDIDRKLLDRFKQNRYGLYHVIGNVSEYMSDGNAIGGDWDTYPSRSMDVINVDEPNPRVGFRIVMEEI